MCRLDIHADDYALSPNTSEDILQCLRAGKLNSISVLTNMACYKAYAEKFRREKATAAASGGTSEFYGRPLYGCAGRGKASDR